MPGSRTKGGTLGGVWILWRSEAGKETSGHELRGGRIGGDVSRRQDVGKVQHHVRTQCALGMPLGSRGGRGPKHDVGCVWTRHPRLRRKINFSRCIFSAIISRN